VFFPLHLTPPPNLLRPPPPFPRPCCGFSPLGFRVLLTFLPRQWFPQRGFFPQIGCVFSLFVLLSGRHLLPTLFGSFFFPHQQIPSHTLSPQTSSLGSLDTSPLFRALDFFLSVFLSLTAHTSFPPEPIPVVTICDPLSYCFWVKVLSSP